MMNRSLMLAALALVLAGSAAATENNQPPADPNTASAATQDCKCPEAPAAATEGDPQAPQNQVEYGGA